VLTCEGKVTEIQLKPGGRAAWIACPPKAFPAPGQYLLAWNETAVLGTAVFRTAVFRSAGNGAASGFQAAAPVPVSWEPGSPLKLRGPLGKSFGLPAYVKRLALIALGDTAERLLPLAEPGPGQNRDIALVSDAPLPSLPASIEIHSLKALPEVLAWADFLALDLPLEALPGLRAVLGLEPGRNLQCPAQALILTPMPCAGLAECGACATPARRGWKLACADGPVIDLQELDW
jgi:hypothetical protein